jgi:molybdopterin converting factor small subunit
MVQVNLWGSLKPSAGGAASIDIEAETIRELFRKIEEQYPGMKMHIDRGLAVSINGRIWRDNWGEKIPPNAEVYLLPRIQGG